MNTQYSFLYIRYIYNYLENKELSPQKFCDHISEVCGVDMWLTEDELLTLITQGHYIGEFKNLNEIIISYLLMIVGLKTDKLSGIEITGSIFALFMLNRIINENQDDWSEIFRPAIAAYAKIIPYIRSWDAIGIFLNCFDTESLYRYMQEEIEDADPEIEDIYLQTIRRINQNN